MDRDLENSEQQTLHVESKSGVADCNEVWMSGANIRMRANKDQETLDASSEMHRAN